MENANGAVQEADGTMLQTPAVGALLPDDYALLEEVLSAPFTADGDLPEYSHLSLDGSRGDDSEPAIVELPGTPTSPSLRHAEVAALLGVTERTLLSWRMARRGPRCIGCRKAGIRYRAADVAYLLKAKTAGQRALRHSRRWL